MILKIVIICGVINK